MCAFGPVHTAGLTPDRFYYFGVRAINNAGVATSWSTLGSSFTKVSPPVLPSTFSALTSNALRVEWAEGGNQAPVTYDIQRSADNFSPIQFSTSVTRNFFNDSGLSVK